MADMSGSISHIREISQNFYCVLHSIKLAPEVMKPFC